MNWNEFRRPDGSIDLCRAYDNDPCRQQYNDHVDWAAHSILGRIEAAQPINSRQAAAIALVTAEWLAVGQEVARHQSLPNLYREHHEPQP